MTLHQRATAVAISIILISIVAAYDFPDFDNLDGLASLPAYSGVYDIPEVGDGHIKRWGEYWNTITCTGSMRPVLTCEDKVLLKSHGFFSRENIKVGTIISYDLDSGGDDNSDELGHNCDYGNSEVDYRALHRVVEIKREGIETYYLTRGDARDSVDRCWKPFGTIAGYVVAMNKGGAK